jgi:hypothetical protein
MIEASAIFADTKIGNHRPSRLVLPNICKKSLEKGKQNHLLERLPD